MSLQDIKCEKVTLDAGARQVRVLLANEGTADVSCHIRVAFEGIADLGAAPDKDFKPGSVSAGKTNDLSFDAPRHWADEEGPRWVVVIVAANPKLDPHTKKIVGFEHSRMERFVVGTPDPT